MIMTVRELRNIYFDARTKLLAEAMGISEANVRNLMGDKREVVETADGDYVLLTKKTKIIKVARDE